MTTSLNDLPSEILELIFEELCLVDIGNCTKTCIRWNQILNEKYKNNGSVFTFLDFRM